MPIIELEASEDMIEFAIGDVHGHLDHLKAALRFCASEASAQLKRGRVHLLGDYVDRGPDSASVLEFLMGGASEPWMEWLPIRGNHDHVLAAVWRNPEYELAWQWWTHGGQQTLRSYGWNPVRHGMPTSLRDFIPKRHVEFLESLPTGHLVGQNLFVHAGIKPGISLEEQTDKTLMWIRGDFLDHEGGFEYRVFHGHSIDRKGPRIIGDRVAMDAGCFLSGKLAIAAFDQAEPQPRLYATSRNFGGKMTVTEIGEAKTTDVGQSQTVNIDITDDSHLPGC